MTQDEWMALALKVSLISGFCSVAAWITLYSCLAKWWHGPIGRTLVRLAALTAGLCTTATLSLFFSLSREDRRVVGWIDLGLIALVTPEMLWRCGVWWRLHVQGRLPRDDDGKDA